ICLHQGGLPTVPAWNANKMPLASGLAAEVRRLRSDLAGQMEPCVQRVAGRYRRPVLPEAEMEKTVDGLVERFEISSTNAAAIVTHCLHQMQVSQLPTAERFLIERYVEPPPVGEERAVDGPGRVQFFFHSLIGRAANDALSRILAHRVKEAVGGNALVTIDDYGFLLTLREFQDLGLEEWRELFSAEGAAEDLMAALKNSELVKWNFRGVAQTGLMVPRNQPGRERQIRQLRWSTEILFRVLSEHEPDHPLLEQARREATHAFLDLPGAQEFLRQAADLEWCFVEVPVVSPFAFGIYASKIREGMMLEDPEEAIERLWRQFQAGTGD
ncbi:MAG: helicase, partial [Verrucomicrobiales bacterium]|nr:helicase [Verrucomicrobiales bacterium]